MFSCLICVEVQAAAVSFETPYVKKKVAGSVGHSVTFSWKFSGGVDLVTWGLANDGANDIDRRSGRLLTLDGRGDDVLPPGSVPKAYRGRVNGTRTGDFSSGQASFTLYNVTKDDERFYGCLLTPDHPDGLVIYDFVQLVVVGTYVNARTYKGRRGGCHHPVIILEFFPSGKNIYT